MARPPSPPDPVAPAVPGGTGGGGAAPITEDPWYREALRVVAEANRRGIVLRLLGATSFICRCPRYNWLYRTMNRTLSDIDVVTDVSTPLDTLDRLFADLGYKKQEYLIWHASSRLIYDAPGSQGLHVDVFRGRLEFCHPIDFRGRLAEHPVTIPLPEMVLEKLQIVEINEKDLKDLCILFAEHAVAGGDEVGKEDGIDAGYIARLLAKDWGFWHTATRNLAKVRHAAQTFAALGAEERARIVARVDALLEAIGRQPKSLRWKLRSLLGTRVRWYNEVEEVAR